MNQPFSKTQLSGDCSVEKVAPVSGSKKVAVIFSAIWKAFEIQDFWESGMTTDMSHVGCNSLSVLYHGRMNGDDEATIRRRNSRTDLVAPPISDEIERHTSSFTSKTFILQCSGYSRNSTAKSVAEVSNSNANRRGDLRRRSSI